MRREPALDRPPLARQTVAGRPGTEHAAAISAKILGQAVSICIYCGQDHAATLRICPKTGKTLGNSAQTSQKTLFGVAPAPPLPAPKPSTSKDLTPLSVSLPPPARSQSPAMAKTMFVGAPPLKAAAQSQPSARRLPTAQEARDNPDLVISLDVTPPAGYSVKTATPPRQTASFEPVTPPVDLPPSVAAHAEPTPVKPVAGGLASVSVGQAARDAPVDLPPVGAGQRFMLPQPPEDTARRTPTESSRTVRDAKAVFAMLGWAVGNYLRNPKQFLLLAAFLVLPASIVESCLLTGAVPAEPTTLAKIGSTVDFSARKAELAARIQQSQARGQVDKQAAAELAAFTSVETAIAPLGSTGEQKSSDWLRFRLASLIQGFLLFGLAVPLALAALALATIDQEAGVALPGLTDVWAILTARTELFLVSLLPAALLVAVGHALFVLPGLVLSLFFVFVPHVVLFEKRRGRAALLRSLELVKTDARQAVFALLALGLAGFLAALLAELVFPTSVSRAVTFIHFLFADLLAVAVLPVPAMVLAKIYLDIRTRT